MKCSVLGVCYLGPHCAVSLGPVSARLAGCQNANPEGILCVQSHDDGLATLTASSSRSSIPGQNASTTLEDQNGVFFATGTKISSSRSYTILDRDKKREGAPAAPICGRSPSPASRLTSSSLPRCRRPRAGRARSCSPSACRS